jgi:hypothetical protein
MKRCQSGCRAEQDVVHQLGLHDADGIGYARQYQHRVEQRRVIGGQYQWSSVV